MTAGDRAPPFAALVDLASRAFGGSVVTANDETFAARENLITVEEARFDPVSFGPKGKVYDGWETRRRREEGHDYAVVRLGAPGIVHGVVVDTAYFRRNYPPEVSVEATSVEGYPSVDELLAGPWEALVPRSPARGDTVNSYAVADRRRWTHVRLSIHPDGGVARLRVHGVVVPDPRFLIGTVDLAAAENGGRVVGCSDAFYSSPGNLLLPGRPRHMGEGWENARRRGGGNDWVAVALGAAGNVRHVEVDTSYFVGNAPGWVRLSVADVAGAPAPVPSATGDSLPHAGSVGVDVAAAAAWAELLPRTRVQPDTRHRFVIDGRHAATLVRLDVYPDGGVARLRVWGEVRPDALADARRRWWAALPEWHRRLLPAEAALGGE